MNTSILIVLFLVLTILSVLVFTFVSPTYKVNNKIFEENEIHVKRDQSTASFSLIDSEDGTQLFLRKWLDEDSDDTKIDQCILILHGITAHSGAYDFLGKIIAKNGYPCFGLDYRGHGLSDGNRADCKSRSTWVNDITAAVHHIKSQGYKKIVILGHSLGAAAAIYTTKEIPEEIAGLILLSAAKEGRKGVRKEPSLRSKIYILLNSLFRPSKQVIEYYRENISGLEDPLFNFRYTLRFVRMLDINLLHLPEEMEIPILVVIGERDELFSIEHARSLYDEMPGDRKWFHIIPNAYHAKFPNENWAFLIEWLQLNYH